MSTTKEAPFYTQGQAQQFKAAAARHQKTIERLTENARALAENGNELRDDLTQARLSLYAVVGQRNQADTNNKRLRAKNERLRKMLEELSSPDMWNVNDIYRQRILKVLAESR